MHCYDDWPMRLASKSATYYLASGIVTHFVGVTKVDFLSMIQNIQRLQGHYCPRVSRHSNGRLHKRARLRVLRHRGPCSCPGKIAFGSQRLRIRKIHWCSRCRQRYHDSPSGLDLRRSGRAPYKAVAGHQQSCDSRRRGHTEFISSHLHFQSSSRLAMCKIVIYCTLFRAIKLPYQTSEALSATIWFSAHIRSCLPCVNRRYRYRVSQCGRTFKRI